MGTTYGVNLNNNTTANINNIVTDQIKLYYDVGRTYCYSGSSTLKDLSGNGINLTLYSNGGTTYSTVAAASPEANYSRLGELVFDGINDWGKFTAFSIGSNVTVSVWIKTTYSGGAKRGIFSHCSGGPVGISYNIVGGKMNYEYYSGGWLQTTGTTTVNDGTWKNLVWVKSGTSMTMYINGVQDFTTTLSADVSGSMACVGSSWGACNSDSYGAGTDSYGTVFSGSLAIFMCHLKALSLAEVTQNYNNLKRRFI